MRGTNGILAVLTPVYDVEISVPSSYVPRVERSQVRTSLVYWLHLANAGIGVSVKYTRRWIYAEYPVTLCAGCRARPSLWDIDCDGPYDTVQCGTCNWWAAFALYTPELAS